MILRRTLRLTFSVLSSARAFTSLFKTGNWRSVSSSGSCSWSSKGREKAHLDRSRSRPFELHEHDPLELTENAIGRDAPSLGNLNRARTMRICAGALLIRGDEMLLARR